MIENRITGKTKLLAVIGNPIEHSISPQLHNTISRELGLDLIYVPFQVEPNNLGDAVKGLRALDIAGFNITIPYKSEIIDLLDKTQQDALLMGAVNTVKNEFGRLIGFNTDAEGFARAFKEETHSDFSAKKVVLLGAGGAARALAVKIAMERALSLSIINRTKEKADEISDLVNKNINPVAQGMALNTKDSLEAFYLADIIVNTIPVGMYPDIGKTPVEGYSFRSGQIVYDAIYNPAKTVFLSQAETNGCLAVNGLGWLFYQGVLAYEIWNGITIENDLLERIFFSFKSLFGNE